jgi:hypothetical protein
VFVSERHATTAWTRMSHIPISRCLVGALRDGLGSSATLSVQSTHSARSGLAPHELGVRVTFRISGSAGKIDGRIGYYVFARGRAVGALIVMSFGKPLQPVPLALEQKLAGLVASRLRG